MSAIHPDADLAPRDVVAREVWKRTCAGARVYLDAAHVFHADPTAFPAVRALCAAYRIDALRSPIPVVPAAHYHMGGIAVDLEGRSSFKHLWACGEVACTGVHGANRLASNSLLEAVVFGRRLGQALASQCDRSLRREDAVVEPASDGATLDVDAQRWSALRQLMWEHLGIVREASGLQAGLANVRRIEQEIPHSQVLLRNRVRLMQAMLAAALARQTSRGAHFRSDFPLGEDAGAIPDQGAQL